MEQLKNHPEKQNNTRVMFMVFNTTFNNFQVYRDGKFYWWKKKISNLLGRNIHFNRLSLSLVKKYKSPEFHLTRINSLI
jgi:hypothetical protein